MTFSITQEGNICGVMNKRHLEIRRAV